jgi:uncharacterized protein
VKPPRKQAPLSDEDFERLLYACRFHNDGGVSSDPTVGACRDADRLDLPRVGITPQARYFSTRADGDLIGRI